MSFATGANGTETAATSEWLREELNIPVDPGRQQRRVKPAPVESLYTEHIADKTAEPPSCSRLETSQPKCFQLA